MICIAQFSFSVKLTNLFVGVIYGRQYHETLTFHHLCNGADLQWLVNMWMVQQPSPAVP